jgi:hypothetical protein
VVVVVPAVMVVKFTKWCLMCIASLKKCLKKKKADLEFSKCCDLLAEACCVGKLTVLHICRETRWKEKGAKKLFLAPRKHINIPKKSVKPR